VNLLLRQVSLVLVVDSQFLQALELSVLDAFNLDTLVLELLSDLAALLEVVKSALLLDFVVLSNLVPDSSCVILEGALSLLLNSLLVLLVSFLSVDDFEEGVALSLGLLGVHDFLLHELFLAGLFELSSQHLLSQGLVLFILSGLSFTFFISTFGSQSIDFTLSVRCFLLEFTEALNLLLLLVSQALVLDGCLFLLSCFRSVVVDDLLVFSLGNVDLFLFLYLGDSICGLDFSNHLFVAFFLPFGGYFVLLLLDFDCTGHLSLLSLKNFPFLLPLDLSPFDLVDDDSGTTSLGVNAGNFSLLGDLKSLQSFDFHHEIEAFLLVYPVCFKSNVLIQLLVSDRYDLGVEDHLVHVLDIVMLFVHLLLGFGKETLTLLPLSLLDVSCWNLGGTVLVKLLHFGLAGGGGRHLGLFHVLLDFHLCFLLLDGLNLGGGLHASDIVGGEDGSVSGGSLSFLHIFSHFSKFIV